MAKKTKKAAKSQVQSRNFVQYGVSSTQLPAEIVDPMHEIKELLEESGDDEETAIDNFNGWADDDVEGFIYKVEIKITPVGRLSARERNFVPA